MRIWVFGGVVLLASVAGAQTLTAPTFSNASNPNEVFGGTPMVPSFERESATELLSSAAGGFVTRYRSLVTADGDGGASSGLIEPLTSDYTILFSVTAPGAYRLGVGTTLMGDLNLRNDDVGGAAADLSGVSGSFTAGTLESGALGLPDPGIVSGTLGGSVPVSLASGAVLFGVSDGVAVPHTLRFTWFQTASTDAGGGDEAAVRLGGTSDVASETAGDYPGSPSRTQADDGHFVTVTLTSLCGNGVLDTGPSYAEQCDLGAGNGQPGGCCASDCTFVTSGTACDDGNACTTGETCGAGACTGGAVQTCPLCETCDPMGGCVQGPRAACTTPVTPLRARLQLKDRTPDTGDLLVWKWIRGDATSTASFGSPTTTDDYALCVFAPGLVFQADAPAGGTCGTKPCWKALGIKGFAYKDKDRTPDGLDKVLLKAGLAGKAKALVKGRGANLPALPLPLPLPAIVQLQAESGGCWESTFFAAGTLQNDATAYKGKAGSPSGAFVE